MEVAKATIATILIALLCAISYRAGAKSKGTTCMVSKEGVSASQHYPFPNFKMVLTTSKDESNTCELIGNHSCDAVAKGELFLPEWFVREAVASFLVPCLYRHCLAFDIGANIGFVTSYMASLGASVTAIEPQPVLAAALQRTIENNCWQGRVQVHNAFISVDPNDKGKVRTEKTSALWNIATAHGDAKQDHSIFASPYYFLPEALLQAGHVDFIKLDIDSIEPVVVHKLYRLLSRKDFTFTTLIFEVNLAYNSGEGFSLVANAFRGFQIEFGYDIYKFNQHEQRHWFDSRGVDIYASGPHAYADSPFVEERFSQRFMRHLLWFRPQTSVKKWARNLQAGLMKRERELGKPHWTFTNSFLVTRERLMEPIRMEGYASQHPSAEGLAYHRSHRSSH